MTTRSPLRALCAVLAVLAVLPMTACTASPPPRPATPPNDLSPLVMVVLQRLDTADAVAGAKWRSGEPVTDPARERAVVDAARIGATQRRLDPEIVASVFRDQIEASKVVQYRLLSDWTADPSRAPAPSPDLAEIRPELDRLTTALLDALAATRTVRQGFACPSEREGAVAAAVAQVPVDPLHRLGLDRALASTCR